MSIISFKFNNISAIILSWHLNDQQLPLTVSGAFVTFGRLGLNNNRRYFASFFHNRRILGAP